MTQTVAAAAVEFSDAYALAKGEPNATGLDAEKRLISILVTGKLKGAVVFQSSEPVICFSEPSEAARRVMLRDGVVASRGPYAPWGLMFHREALIDRGLRPVLYLSSEEMEATKQLLPVQLRNRRVRYDPGSSDWLHEREWRLCFCEGEQPELLLTQDLVAGVIVGRKGWTPPVVTVRNSMDFRSGGSVGHVWSSRYAHGLARWWWTGKELVEDGAIDLGEPEEDGGSAPYQVQLHL